MAYNWLKWFHGAVTDDKWPMVARKSGQPVAVVVAVWAALLECASQAEDRGSVEDFDAESMDAVLQVEDGACAAIVEALSSGKRPRIVDGRITKWEARQEETQDPTGRERKRRQRERDKEVRERDKGNGCPADGHGVTGDNVTCHGNDRDVVTHDVTGADESVTGHADVPPSRLDKTRLDKNINTPPPIDIFKYKDARVAQSVPEGGEGEEYLDPPNAENAPGIEFQEIRIYYDKHGRKEAPRTGFQEYLALKKSHQWPGQSAIYMAIDRLSTQDGPWLAGKAPGLAKFFREEWWRMPPRPGARASPLSATEGKGNLAQRNAKTSMRVLAEMEGQQ